MPRITTPGRRRTPLVLLVVATALAALLSAAVPTYSIDTRQTGRLDKRGFPLYYTDDRGTSLKLCQTGTRQCQGAKRSDLVSPNGEAFYWMATSTVRTSRGPLDVEFALEAAFGGARGRLPIVFERIRIRGHLNQRGHYILEHPYGTTTFRAITKNEQRNVDFTRDRGCSTKRRGPCADMITNFLRAAVTPPKGYVGFGGRRTPVVGGAFGNDLVVRAEDGTFLGSNDKFMVMGRRAGPLANR